jgi:adenosylcobyric acid synthase
VLSAFRELAADADLIIVEGAGSASEVNLRHNDIANFGFARAANVPVVVIGDIHRGGVIAALVGTFNVIDPADAKLIAATLVNRFQGDPTLFADGKTFIAERTGVPCLGPIPEFPAAAKLPAEDILALEAKPASSDGSFVIAVPRLPRIANFDDLDPLAAEPGVKLIIVEPGRALPQADLIIMPGSKATMADLAVLRENGWEIDILAHWRRGGSILGICGGYQMLGQGIADAAGIEGPPGNFGAGIGLLDVTTMMMSSKDLRLERATHIATGEPLSGYHMHMGITTGGDTGRPFATVDGEGEGAISADGRVMGTYLHGLFASDGFRTAFLKSLGVARTGETAYEESIDLTLDALAAHLEQNLDLDALLALAREPA